MSDVARGGASVAVSGAATGVVIVADDRTGALETAGGLAQTGGQPVQVLVGGCGAANGVVQVIDVATRHLAPAMAAERVIALGLHAGSSRIAHKVDSLLRGNFVAEIGALRATTGRRVVLVPAAPALGRTCVSGVVCADGVPVDQLADARAPATTSRPAVLLDADEIDPAGLDEWLRGRGAVAVCDAATAHHVASIAATLAGVPDVIPDVILSAPAAVLTATLALTLTRPAAPAGAVTPTRTWSLNVSAGADSGDHVGWVGGGGDAGECVVVVGSVHPMALAQADAVSLLDGVRVIRADLAAAEMADETVAETADQIVAELAARAGPHLADARVIVIVGGDTAAAVLGDEPVTVHGLVGEGMPWLRSPRYPNATVITKPGSFGHASLLVDVLVDVLADVVPEVLADRQWGRMGR